MLWQSTSCGGNIDSCVHLAGVSRLESPAFALSIIVQSCEAPERSLGNLANGIKRSCRTASIPSTEHIFPLPSDIDFGLYNLEDMNSAGSRAFSSSARAALVWKGATKADIIHANPGEPGRLALQAIERAEKAAEQQASRAGSHDPTILTLRSTETRPKSYASSRSLVHFTTVTANKSSEARNCTSLPKIPTKNGWSLPFLWRLRAELVSNPTMRATMAQAHRSSHVLEGDDESSGTKMRRV